MRLLNVVRRLQPVDVISAIATMPCLAVGEGTCGGVMREEAGGRDGKMRTVGGLH